MKPETNKLLPINKAAEWALQAARQQQWTEAAQRWSVLRKAYPEHAMVWLQGAKAHIEADALDQAAQLLEYARQHFPDNVNSFLISAELAIKLERWKETEAYLQQCRENFPHFAQTWILSAEYSEHRGKQDKAIEYNGQARKCAPEQIAPFIQYAELAMRAQHWNDALERWELLRTHFPKHPIGYQRAAEAARKSGNNRLARELTLSLEYGDSIISDKSPKIAVTKKRRSRNLFGLIWAKAIFNLRSENQRNHLSNAWLVLEPMLHILVFYIVFGLLLQRGGENFLVFLFAGQIPWLWISKSVSGSSGSILAGQNLMLQTGLPAIVFPLINLLKISIQQVLMFLLLFGFLWWQGYYPNVLWWWFFPVMLVQLLLIIAATCAVAAVIPFARDLNYLVQTGLMLLMFGSGIFYDYRTLPIEFQDVFLLNPVAFLLKSYRDILIDGVLPDYIMLGYWGLGSLIACLIIVKIYSRLQYIYPRIVME
ncbi:ABC transporter permease [Methyloprofundus sp.]|uniref:ABC transporter permease n=1 Tax=Methyloprofundus sp. TaxID=2020875 RepID=UPI003D147EB4